MKTKNTGTGLSTKVQSEEPNISAKVTTKSTQTSDSEVTISNSSTEKSCTSSEMDLRNNQSRILQEITPAKNIEFSRQKQKSHYHAKSKEQFLGKESDKVMLSDLKNLHNYQTATELRSSRKEARFMSQAQGVSLASNNMGKRIQSSVEKLEIGRIMKTDIYRDLEEKHRKLQLDFKKVMRKCEELEVDLKNRESEVDDEYMAIRDEKELKEEFLEEKLAEIEKLKQKMFNLRKKNELLVKEVESVKKEKNRIIEDLELKIEQLNSKSEALQKKILTVGTQRMRDRSQDRFKQYDRDRSEYASTSHESALMIRNKQLRDEIEKVHVKICFNVRSKIWI
jgi:hypothetical protein